jgi:hypothetical protein
MITIWLAIMPCSVENAITVANAWMTWIVSQISNKLKIKVSGSSTVSFVCCCFKFHFSNTIKMYQIVKESKISKIKTATLFLFLEYGTKFNFMLSDTEILQHYFNIGIFCCNICCHKVTLMAIKTKIASECV